MLVEDVIQLLWVFPSWNPTKRSVKVQMASSLFCPSSGRPSSGFLKTPPPRDLQCTATWRGVNSVLQRALQVVYDHTRLCIQTHNPPSCLLIHLFSTARTVRCIFKPETVAVQPPLMQRVQSPCWSAHTEHFSPTSLCTRHCWVCWWSRNWVLNTVVTLSP